MAQTAGGTYYAASSELVSSWPATSLNLANQLESRFAAKWNAKVSDTAPTSPAEGDVWVDTTGSTTIAKMWNGSAWLAFSSGVLTASDISATTGSPTITTDATYQYYKFTGSGSLTISATTRPNGGVLDVLIAGAGGGAGGSTSGNHGGGGAGGFIETALNMPAGTHTITVGLGGAGGSGTYGGLGGWSQFANIAAHGGGGGGYSTGIGAVYPGQPGASGGGSAAWNTGYTSAYGGSLALEGSNGAPSAATDRTGGGGGAGGAGSTGTANGAGGPGGVGKSSYITGTYYCGGGGGSGTGGTGGNGGGGSNPAGAGTANSGGGGAGGYNSTGGAGGSGVVIVRVKK